MVDRLGVVAEPGREASGCGDDVGGGGEEGNVEGEAGEGVVGGERGGGELVGEGRVGEGEEAVEETG